MPRDFHDLTIPQYYEGLECPCCKSRETAGLLRSKDNNTQYIVWCDTCGEVSACNMSVALQYKWKVN